MDERDMRKEEQNGKRKGWGIERKMLFLLGTVIALDKTVYRNRKGLSSIIFLRSSMLGPVKS
jgi:hypothetical protein